MGMVWDGMVCFDCICFLFEYMCLVIPGRWVYNRLSYIESLKQGINYIRNHFSSSLIRVSNIVAISLLLSPHLDLENHRYLSIYVKCE